MAGGRINEIELRHRAAYRDAAGGLCHDHRRMREQAGPRPEARPVGGLESQPEDLGQTLGVWGFGAGAYIVWPVFGPSSVRDSAGLPLDLMASPATVINDGATKVEITTLQLVNKRANLLGASRVLDDIALDKYSFVRDAYLARRRSLVYDGNPPEPKTDDEDKEAPAAPAAPASAASAASGPAK